MKYRMRNIFLLLSSAAFGFVPTESPACAPYFQPYYMQGKSPYPTVFRRKAAVRRLIAELRDLIPARPEIPDGVPMEAAVSQDFKAAVNQHLPRLSPEEKEKLVRINVFNTGKTLAEDDLEKVWIKFYKVDKARTREYGGSGIGLSIVKAIMESLGMKCGVENRENGVNFWFEVEKAKN